MKVAKTKYDIIMSVMGFLVLMGTSVFLLITWKQIPQQVPKHYNAAGVADSMTGKGIIIFELVFGWILFIILWVVEQFPQIWNTGVKVTEQNKWQVYHILKNMIVTLRFVLAAIYSFIAIEMASGKNLPVYFTVLILLLVFGDIGWSWARLIKAGRQ